MQLTVVSGISIQVQTSPSLRISTSWVNCPVVYCAQLLEKTMPLKDQTPHSCVSVFSTCILTDRQVTGKRKKFNPSRVAKVLSPIQCPVNTLYFGSGPQS